MDATRLQFQKTLEDVKVLVQAGCFQSAAKRLGELRLHLEQRLETEGRLVPIFVRRTGDARGLEERLGRDRGELLRSLQAVQCGISQWALPTALSEIGRLGELLAGHLVMEEELRPALTDLVPEDGDWQALGHLLLRIPRV
jgi:hypothetical protein